MCSIWYFNKEYFSKEYKWKELNYIEKVEDRWLDSLGILSLISDQRKVKKSMPSVRQQYSFDTKLEDDYAKDLKGINSSCMIHLRNSSVWAVTLKNWHPYIWERYVLAQNWTSRELHDFFKVKGELEWFYHDRYGESDSAALLSYIEYQDYTSLKDVKDMLNKVQDVLWIIFIYDKDTGNALIYSDACRELYIEEREWYLIRAENYKSLTEKEWFTTWYVIFNFKTSKIIEKQYTMKIKVKKTPITNTYAPWMYWKTFNY